MFDALTSKLNDVFRGLRGRGKVTEANAAEVLGDGYKVLFKERTG